YLSSLTGDKKYWDAVATIGKIVSKLEKLDRLAPIFVSTSTGEWATREIRLGSRGDSYYQYLGKQYLLTNDTGYLDEYRVAVAGIRKHLLGLSFPNEYFFIGELPNPVSELSPKMDHLVCFLPGTLALVATRGKRTVTMAERLALDHVDLLDLELAEELATGCWQQYHQTLTGLSPEIVFWQTKPLQPAGSNSTTVLSIAEEELAHGHNLLRPETIESFFVLFRITGDPIWRERGWLMFKVFEQWCKVDGGYTSLDDVRVIPPPTRDKMETFFLGETLKYFYLLFVEPLARDDPAEARRLVHLEDYVLNTEAHPIPKFAPPPGFE
ncbi:glycoside hydrolase, partial [Powellomyces hirtus]